MNTHFSPEFIEAQKAKLLQSKEEIIAGLAHIAKYDEASGTYMAIQPEFGAQGTEDSGESGMESEVGQTNMALIADHQKMLDEVEAALAKIEENKYGICEQTGDWIEEDRLRAYPAARTCEDEAE